MSFSTFKPVLRFVCKLCRHSLANCDELIEHKIKNHFEDCRRVQAIIFEETIIYGDSHEGKSRDESENSVVFELIPVKSEAEEPTALTPLPTSATDEESNGKPILQRNPEAFPEPNRDSIPEPNPPGRGDPKLKTKNRRRLAPRRKKLARCRITRSICKGIQLRTLKRPSTEINVTDPNVITKWPLTKKLPIGRLKSIAAAHVVPEVEEPNLELYVEPNSELIPEPKAGRKRLTKRKKRNLKSRVCEYCNLIFARATTRDRHMRNKHDPNKKKIPCNHCAYEGNEKDDLARHMRRKHTFKSLPSAVSPKKSKFRKTSRVVEVKKPTVGPNRKPKRKPSVVQNTERNIQPNAESNAEPNLLLKPEPSIEPTPEPSPESFPEPKRKPTLEQDTEPNLQPNAESNAELNLLPKPEPEPDTELNPELIPEPNVLPERLHRKKRRSKNSRVCEYCNRTFTRTTTKDRHMRNKHDPNKQKIPCNLCAYKGNEKDDLTRHIRRKHSNTLGMKWAGLRTPPKKRLDHRPVNIPNGRHEIEKNKILKISISRIRLKFLCNYCDYECSDKKDLLNHTGLKHSC